MDDLDQHPLDTLLLVFSDISGHSFYRFLCKVC